MTPEVVRARSRYAASVEKFDANAAARADQQYTTRPDGCWNCEHLEYDTRMVGNGVHDRYGTHPEQFNPHCGIGGFAVVKTAKCQKHERKTTPSE